MVAFKEMPLPTMDAAGTDERFSNWSTSKNIGILILTLVVLAIVSGICIHYVLTPGTSVELHQRMPG